MSILIRGMEMPTSCEKCPCKTADAFGGLGCQATGYIPLRKVNQNRPDWCPLIPVPPHGDLIDRDALSKSLNALCDRVCQYSKAQRKVMCGACPLGDAFAVVEDDAPTIIEAEEGET